jgi:hypothetical protein
MRRSLARPAVLFLALATLSCEGDGGPTGPPDSAECANTQATFTIVAPPVTFDEIGTLTTASCKLGRGSYADRWELIVPNAVDVDISLTSDDFDAYIYLRNSSEDVIGSDDDGGSGGFNDGNSRLAGRIQPGTYYIMTTTFNDDAVGNYALSVAVTAPPIG